MLLTGETRIPWKRACESEIRNILEASFLFPTVSRALSSSPSVLQYPSQLILARFEHCYLLFPPSAVGFSNPSKSLNLYPFCIRSVGFFLQAGLLMASVHFYASFAAKGLVSFEGLRPCSAKLASFGTYSVGLGNRSFRGLYVKAATVVAPKVCSICSPCWFLCILCRPL